MHHQRSLSPIPSCQDWACGENWARGPSICTNVLILYDVMRGVFDFYSLLILFIYIYL